MPVTFSFFVWVLKVFGLDHKNSFLHLWNFSQKVVINHWSDYVLRVSLSSHLTNGYFILMNHIFSEKCFRFVCFFLSPKDLYSHICGDVRSKSELSPFTMKSHFVLPILWWRWKNGKFLIKSKRWPKVLSEPFHINCLLLITYYRWYLFIENWQKE